MDNEETIKKTAEHCKKFLTNTLEACFDFPTSSAAKADKISERSALLNVIQATVKIITGNEPITIKTTNASKDSNLCRTNHAQFIAQNKDNPAIAASLNQFAESMLSMHRLAIIRNRKNRGLPNEFEYVSHSLETEFIQKPFSSIPNLDLGNRNR